MNYRYFRTSYELIKSLLFHYTFFISNILFHLQLAYHFTAISSKLFYPDNYMFNSFSEQVLLFMWTFQK